MLDHTDEKEPVLDAYELNKELAYQLARAYETPWRSFDTGGHILLTEAGVYGVLIGERRWGDMDIMQYEWQRLELTCTDYRLKGKPSPELISQLIDRPAMHVLLQGQQHSYYFYVKAGTIQEALANLFVAKIMSS